MGLKFSPRCFPRPKQWAVGIDYFHKLSAKERAWLIRFQSEFHNGEVKKGDRRAFHRRQDLRRDCYQRTNLAMRDLYAIKSGCNLLSDDLDRVPGESNEDRLIRAMDLMRFPNAGLVARAFLVLDRYLEETNHARTA